ncbi:ABC transporter, permease protein 2 (cluster 5, nickel/peptides/opines) [Olavius algarvensis associated proteobacterium Delta 3]|nr:ABC transporter, permease protein 2 (cluster 5, nickel/peptides/opines) [Olavius algarvensis associated proteobacterium Delta 3]CAB5144299.1 ABC transporter, permease protein 2 (cluster 5, nickel/peptides/opines) [Olavius algarvensis associated proteobacterium Delta 3]
MSERKIKSRILYSYLHDPSAIIGSIILVVFIFAAVFAPWIAPQDPYDLEQLTLDHFLTPPIWMEGGTWPFLLGTDDQGRGILSTILYGCRTSLIVGFSVVAIAGTFGVIIGLLAGFYGGWLDIVTMRLADTFFSFSTTFMAFLFLGIFGGASILVVIFAICMADWVRYARTMRGSVLEVREASYIVAARATGARDFRILLRHLMPNAIPPVFVVLAVDLAVVIMLEATLSFLGVGVPLTEPSLGMMISIGKNYIYAGMWWMIVFPGATLILLVVGINLFADWLREELNPKIERA